MQIFASKKYYMNTLAPSTTRQYNLQLSRIQVI